MSHIMPPIISGALGFITERPITHRGLHDGNKACWENTLSGFQKAIDHKFAIECDVTLSADGVAMVFHDHKLQRLTGESGEVESSTSRDLQAMQIGGTADRIPTLAETLALVAGQVPIIIELKGVEGAGHDLVGAVARDLADYRGDAAIMSFDHWLVRHFKGDCPDRPRGLTAEGLAPEAMEAHGAMLPHDMHFVSYSVKELDNPFVALCRDRLAMPIITWTVRTEADVAATQKFAHQMTFEGFLP